MSLGQRQALLNALLLSFAPFLAGNPDARRTPAGTTVPEIAQMALDGFKETIDWNESGNVHGKDEVTHIHAESATRRKVREIPAESRTVQRSGQEADHE